MMTVPVAPFTPRPPTRSEQRKLDRQAARQARFDEVAALHARGWSQSAISRSTGLDRSTIRTWLQAGRPPSWSKPAYGSAVDVHADYLRQRWNEIRAVLEDPRRLADEYRRRLGAPRTGPCEIDALATLERQISSLRRGISRLIDSYAEGLIDRTEFQPRIMGMKQRLARLEENRHTLVETAETEQNLALIIGRLEDFSDKVHQALDGLDWHGTRDIIRMMIRRIEVDGDHVEIVFRVPPIMPMGDDHPPFRLASPRGGDWQHCPCRILPVRPQHPQERQGAPGLPGWRTCRLIPDPAPQNPG
ncbi:transcriptional regulator with XRE-family HTH domain [Skermanella aerolata]|uniref:hypothetical protein n=1 Tax=Skermanella aerolata TaxID=393310 RepID=UPI003D1E75DF